MNFIKMEFIGPFNMTTKDNQYILTVVCILTNFVICVPLTGKSAEKVEGAYLREVYCRLHRSRQI